MQIRISGGVNDTDVNEFIVSPWGVPVESQTAAIATPVAKRPQARLGIRVFACLTPMHRQAVAKS